MEYGEFKTKLKEKICAAFPLDEYSVVIREVCKNNNTTKQGIFIKRNGSDATPIFYFDELWDAFQSGTSIEGLIDFIREYLQAADKSDIETITQMIIDYERVKEKIYCKLVKIKGNDELLRTHPYKTYLDIAVIYYIAVDMTRTLNVSEALMGIWGINKYELDEQAWKNTLKDLSPFFSSMHDVLRELTGADDFAVKNEEFPLYILSNEQKHFGAICIRYPGILKEISEKVGGSFYILPSSVHEWIIIPAYDCFSVDELSGLVQAVNDKEVEPEEVLSDHAYFYSTALGQIVF